MQNLNLSLIKRTANNHRPLIFNSVLWSLAFVILLFIFSKGHTPILVDYIYTLSFLIVIAIPVSINIYSLIPKFLKQEKYGLYVLCCSINYILFSLLSLWLLQPILDFIFPSYFFIAYLSKANLLLLFAIFLVATTLLKLAEDWFYFNTNENKMLRAKNQQIASQLSALRAQINPHFLFNSLNVIYALALEQQKETTTAIVQLSDILRYVIYDSETDRVSLKNEIKLLENYIAFQQHRLEIPNATQIKINVQDEQYKIYPMLLLPLLENSYKFGFISGKPIEPIVIELEQQKNSFRFCITNANLNTQSDLDTSHSGVGLENIRKNLNLVYPNQHEFTVEAFKNQFKVTLSIKNEY